MGLFSSLIGWDQHLGALNAVMANYVIEKESDCALRKIIAKDVIERILNRNQHNPLDYTLQQISKEPRVVQMNFIALSCDYLGIKPLPNQVWSLVRNPYFLRDKINYSHIEAAIHTAKKSSGIAVSWPGNEVKINFTRMYEEGCLN